MKVAIITILDNINLGTVFQAYALADKVTDLGYEAEIINYCRNVESVKYKMKQGFCLSNPVKSLFDIIKSCVVAPYIKKRLKAPIKKDFNLSRCYSSIDELRNDCPQADLFLTGSDQVWNCYYNGGIDDVFFLNFTDNRKAAYAASVGMDEFPENMVEEICNLLKSYEKITVRELATRDYLRKLGFAKVECVLDPTLLLTKDEWLTKFSIPKKKLVEGNYLLVYSVESKKNDFIFEQARKIAKEKNLKLIALTAGAPFLLRKYKHFCDKIFSFATTYIFLQLFRDASFIVASSFHGTAFSINFNKEFITITPPRFDVRMRSIIDEFSLQSRIVTDKFVDLNTLKPIDYKKLNSRLDQIREFSLAQLEDMLKTSSDNQSKH